MTQFHQQLLRWQQAAKADAAGNLASIVNAYCTFLAQQGIKLHRVNLALTTLHPQIQALRYVWYDDNVDVGAFPAKNLFFRQVHHFAGYTVDEAHMIYGARNSPQFKQSPFHLLMQGVPAVSCPLAPGETYEFPVLNDLAAQGATHYYATNVPGSDGGHVSLVSKQKDGFTAQAIERIRSSLSALGLLLDGALKELILNTVLECYVGHSPRDEIKHGNIRPGALIDIEGAIWFSDIRKYSTHSQNTAEAILIDKLNAYYDCIVPAIYEHQGEVLKLIGDAVLAIFPMRGAQTAQTVCRNAFAAAEAANRAVQQSDTGFQHGIGLHFGKFRYGNIGTLRRMDFTVIGNEVNIAARIEGQCGAQQKTLLMSHAFVEWSGLAAKWFAQASLKGIAGDFALFEPAE